MTTRAFLQSALEGATFAATVLAWLTGVAVVLCLSAPLVLIGYDLGSKARHRFLVWSTSRRLRRRVG